MAGHYLTSLNSTLILILVLGTFTMIPIPVIWTNMENKERQKKLYIFNINVEYFLSSLVFFLLISLATMSVLWAAQDTPETWEKAHMMYHSR